MSTLSIIFLLKLKRFQKKVLSFKVVLDILMYTVGKKYIIIKTLSLILLFNNSGIRTHDLQVNALINRATPLR